MDRPIAHAREITREVAVTADGGPRRARGVK